MLRSASQLTHFVITATDDTLGGVKDFLFDDRSWVVRYVVADTGKWLPGRLVLLPPMELSRPDPQQEVLPVNLTRQQVKESPSLREDEPVSRRREKELHQYFGWHPYWAGPDYPHFVAATRMAGEGSPPKDDGDPHLRSLKEVIGYSIGAQDGNVGHVEDLILDDEKWQFRYIVVDTRNWWPGKKVILSPHWIEEVRWAEREVTVDLSRERIRNGPEYDPSAPVNREYEVRLFDYYGRPRYWE